MKFTHPDYTRHINKINKLKAAKADVASRIQELEEYNEVINLELEKALAKKNKK